MSLISPNPIVGRSGWTKDSNECSKAPCSPLCSLPEWCSLSTWQRGEVRAEVYVSVQRFEFDDRGGVVTWMCAGGLAAPGGETIWRADHALITRQGPVLRTTLEGAVGVSEPGAGRSEPANRRCRAERDCVSTARGGWHLLMLPLGPPCIPSLVWAGALALIFTPLQRWMEARVKRPNLAAVLSLVIIGLLVVVPATWFAQKLAEQAATVPPNIQKQIAAGKWHIDGDQHPHVAHLSSSG